MKRGAYCWSYEGPTIVTLFGDFRAGQEVSVTATRTARVFTENNRKGYETRHANVSASTILPGNGRPLIIDKKEDGSLDDVVDPYWSIIVCTVG
jgi:hypothetical protein